MNDENGWEYYCFPERNDENKEEPDPTTYHCRLPQLSELVKMDFVVCLVRR